MEEVHAGERENLFGFLRVTAAWLKDNRVTLAQDRDLGTPERWAEAHALHDTLRSALQARLDAAAEAEVPASIALLKVATRFLASNGINIHTAEAAALSHELQRLSEQDWPFSDDDDGSGNVH